jgi:putative ABC transport system substrate-binding protein
VGDAVAAGLLADRTRPGGNVTGISSLRSELAAKRLQVLHSLAPAVRRVFVVHERSDPVAASIVRNAVGAGPALGLDVVVRDVDDDADLAAILAQIRPRRRALRGGRFATANSGRRARALARITISPSI